MNLLLFVLAAIGGAFQAQPQRPPSSIEGVVLKLGTTEAIVNANVQLNLEVSDDRRDELERQPQSPDIPPKSLTFSSSQGDGGLKRKIHF